MNDNERMLLRAVVDNDPKKAHAYAKLILNNITAQRDQRFKAELLRKLLWFCIIGFFVWGIGTELRIF